MSDVRRIYVEKKAPYAIKAGELGDEIESFLGISTVDAVRMLIRYDTEGLSDETFEKACEYVFSEPPVDTLYRDKLPLLQAERMFSVEFLPGQYDQRADSAMQCIRFIDEDSDPVIKTAVTYVISGQISEEELARIRDYVINPVDSRIAGDGIPDTLITEYDEPRDVPVIEGFTDMSEDQLSSLYASLSLAMTFKDFLHIHRYFTGEEHRDPTMTEIRVLDTYWSDHCRHTTFSTELKNISFDEGYYREPIETTYQSYLDTKDELYAGRADKYVCLMDIALMGMKKLRKAGKLEDMEVSDEINACSVIVPVEMDYGEGRITEEWLVFFKNETHNHPTEIEPFGGAATCLGGAIRDPLSGRGYVYQAMRVTGAADPTVPVSATLKGKLPQKKLVTGAAAGYSSYGNQIGLATGYVKEIYHPGYVAKRMEIGAVMGAAPRRCVKRENSDPGDIIILLGGRTGRDGCGGATGSSKVHTEKSIETCGAEVQKGNAPTERKIQRMFRREEVAGIIKKCNDFGAGGVSVAIGELAAGLKVDLDKVPKKYAGLDGTELAISESQERMAVVVDPGDVDRFLAYAGEENLEATVVATVTEEPRLILTWRGREIVNLSRAFLDTNGAHQETDVKVPMPDEGLCPIDIIASKKVARDIESDDIKAAVFDTLSELNVCSQKGLVERFDASIGAASVYMPYGGKTQLCETQAMIAKLPTLKGNTDTVTMMSYGFDPYISSWSPYHGAIYAIVSSMSKIVSSGGDYKKIRFTFQEYFKRMTEDPVRWGQPFAALLGAFDAQVGFGLPSIGGKDSMSGTFNDIDVPPTLVSFAVDTGVITDVITPELKESGNKLICFRIEKDDYHIPVYERVQLMYEAVTGLIKSGVIVSAYTADRYGLLAAAAKMAFGNMLGFETDEDIDVKELFKDCTGDILCEVSADRLHEIDMPYDVIGRVTAEPKISVCGTGIPLEEAISVWSEPLSRVFPYKAKEDNEAVNMPLYDAGGSVYVCKAKTAKPNVFIPVFPGTNCEYDSRRAFERAGANVTDIVFKNMTGQDIRESFKAYVDAIDNSQIIMFPGGFSAGDEPDGSAKFFAAAFRNEAVKDAVMRLLNERDGLILGICNGFQALIKLGLVPNGKVTGQNADSPTLTFNTVGRHISKMVYTKVVSNKSPWLAQARLGGVYVNPASHGEGRFVASGEWLDRLIENGQVATVYSDMEGNVSMDEEYNINGSYMAIEGITSADGRILGKMAHSERRDKGVAVNIYGEQDLKIFESGVKYFQ